MKNLIKLTGFALIATVCIACGSKTEKGNKLQSADFLNIQTDHAQIAYAGRMDVSQSDSVDLFWSGSSIKLKFQGDSLFAILKDAKGDNYFNIVLDNDSIRILRPDTVKTRYLLVAGLEGAHQIELFKRTEAFRDKTTFYGFELVGNAAVLKKDKAKSRKIEFYGNSITAAYAVDDTSGKDSPDSVFTNSYVGYAAITARNLNADFRLICRSGIGILISWFPMIMPEMYNRLNPMDSTSRWNFGKYTPDVVVVNLCQNDSWLVDMPEFPEFIHRFGTIKPTDQDIVTAYQEFIISIRDKYPAASIVCILGNMDATQEGSEWPGYIEKAIENMNDEKLFTHFMAYKDTEGHPNRAEQLAMANSLTTFINENVQW